MYIIGIDFGTTNSTLAYTLKKQEGAEELPIHQFQIGQLTPPGGIFKELSMLPSFIYFPFEEELNNGSLNEPWDSKAHYRIGTLAKERGGELPARLISSAKSWLCHSSINRREKLLPQEFDGEKLSPLEACAAILSHIKKAWEDKMSDAPFKEQEILITVPASFDPSARQLIQEASQMAGYPEVILLEEPQAAFYAWLHQKKDSWRNTLKEGDSILVIDVGGGTTDFSFITAKNHEGSLSLERQAVGSHLLLGGDNIDLAIAHLAAAKLEEKGETLDDWQMQSLIQRSREVKEKLLIPDAPEQMEITLMGRGSKLIRRSLTVNVTRKEVIQLVLEGFFPLIKPEERSGKEKQTVLQQVGLPYAQDPRITAQLAKFLTMEADEAQEQIDLTKFHLPSALLFNGGTLKSDLLQQRLVDQLNAWAHLKGVAPVKVLSDPDLDHAVSYGAVNYGLARNGKGIRIKSGTSHSYFIGVADALPAVPGMPPPLRAVCVVPYGLEEGSELELTGQNFALVLGEEATFRFFSYGGSKLPNGTVPQVGTVIKNWKNLLTELHPIETYMEKAEGDSKTIQVSLKSRLTELGVLELWCEAQDKRKWRLEFDLKERGAIRG